MMKKQLLAIFFCLLGTGVSAQNFVIKTGIGLSRWTLSGSEPRFACKLGIGGNLHLATDAELQGMIFLAKRGSNYQAGTKYCCNELYVEVPVHMVVHLNLGFPDQGLALHAGPFFAYGIGGKTTTADGKKMDTFGEYMDRRFDIGFSGGAAYEFESISVGVDAEYGLVRMTGQSYNPRNLGVYAVVGYTF